MSTILLTHESCLEHLTPPGHPERVERQEALNARFAESRFDALTRESAPRATREQLLRAHPARYLDIIEEASPDTGSVALDPDTHMSPGSRSAALRAVGAAIRGVDAVLSGDARSAFCSVRPPGHHAEKARPMGFCLFGTVAAAALHALEHHGLSRVAIMDFDVHHGNGTQDILWDESRIRFASTHQMPLFPGTGAADERGAHDNILNHPLKPFSGGAEMRAAMEGHVLPWLDAFEPELLLISAGFDAHTDDPLAQLEWTVSDFQWITARLCDLAETHCEGRIVSSLEGGYDLDGLADSAAAHVSVLMERGA